VTRSLALTSAIVITVLATALTLGGPAATGATTPPPGYASATVPVEFTLSSFNVLGSKHTMGRGPKARFAPGPKRIRMAARLLDRHGVDVVGFQELQMDQWAEFMRVAGSRYGVYPGGITRRMVQNSVAWSLDTWELIEGQTVQIPYFKGILWDMPIVKLRHKPTGALVYFANFHNPATNRKRGENAHLRADATTREITAVRSLAYATGLPVFVTGDMNERESYFCRMTGEAPMKAANGGRNKAGLCTPPPRPIPVDWIFGTRGRGKFTNWVRDDSRLVNKITDHFMIRTDVKIKRAPVPLVPPTPIPPTWSTSPTPAPTPTPTPTPASPTPTPASPTATATATATATR
jgi:hypothetical protein